MVAATEYPVGFGLPENLDGCHIQESQENAVSTIGLLSILREFSSMGPQAVFPLFVRISNGEKH